jgi:chromosome segregation ATPase
MFSLTPTGTPADTANAYALLAVIADPVASKQRLDELSAEKQAALDATKAAQDAQAELVTQRAAVQAQYDEATKIRDDFDLTASARTKALDDREAQLAAVQETNANHNDDLTARESALSEREAAVKAAEADVATRETAVAKLETDTQALRADYEQKVSALHEALK